MNNNTINVNYPAIYSGTDKSEIVFIDGTPDLNSIFTPGESTQRRFFVTDATIASLDCNTLYPAPLGSDSGFKKASILVFACSGKKNWYPATTTTTAIISADIIYFLLIPATKIINKKTQGTI